MRPIVNVAKIAAGVSIRFSAFGVATAMLVSGGTVGTAFAQDPTPPARPAPALSKRPEAIHGPVPKMPEAARTAGHHGVVIIKGMLGVDGKLKDVVIRQSSKSAVLDQAAIREIADWTFSPALDLNGNPVEIPISVPLDFSNVKGLSYSCRQIVLDTDWLGQTFGAEARKDERLYLMLAGFDVAARLRTGRIGKEPDRFDERWVAALERCRKKPDEQFVDALAKSQ